MINLRNLMVFMCVMALSGMISCMTIPKNHLPLFQRSMVISNQDDVNRIMQKASLKVIDDPAFPNLKVLYMKGTPYEMGFQHGRLLQKDAAANIGQIIKMAKMFADEDMMDEIYDLMAPYIPLEEKEEMRGLAHGAGIPLKLVHWIHAVPEVVEYGPKKKFRKGFKTTSCSNVVAFGKATVDGNLYQLRVLDWIRELGAQKYPVIMVHKPDKGNASVSFSYAGFIGCVSGMNEKKMAFGEMGYGDPPGETLEGIPFVFLFRQIMREADTLDQARNMILDAKRTCSYVYVISDAKSDQDQLKALMFVARKDRVKIFGENVSLTDERDGRVFPPFDDVVYGGAEEEKLYQDLKSHYAHIDQKVLMEMTKNISLNGNMQNVVFKPDTLEAWVSNATTNSSKDKSGKACNQKWYYFNFEKALLK